MMPQTTRDCSFFDRPWTLEDVISIPSGSDFGTGSDDEVREHGVPRVHLVHSQHPDDSLSSISAIVASKVDGGGGVSTESFGEHSQTKLRVTALADTSSESSTKELCVAEDPENSDPSASNSPTEVFFASSVPESPWSTTDSDPLAYPTIQHHDNAASLVLPTPAQGSCVISPASQSASAQPAPILPLGDKVLHQQYADSSCQTPLWSATNLIQSSNWCCQSHIANYDHDHIDGVIPQSDEDLHCTVQPPSTITHLSGWCPISPEKDLTEADCQHQVANDILPPAPCLRSSPNSLRVNERRASTNTHQKVSQIEGSRQEIANRSSRRLGYRKVYSLRPLPEKRKAIGKQQRGDGGERCMVQHKRRKVAFPQSKKRKPRQSESGESRSRNPRLLREKTTEDNDKAFGTNASASEIGVESYEEWSLAHSVLKCNRENGIAKFQLHFTSDTLWTALTARNGPARKGHQPPNKAKDLGLGAKKNQLDQRTEKVAHQSIQAAFPSVCPNIYRMSCLLARWRQHIFLVEWSDATTTWEPRKHIIDKRMLSEFEANWQGFDAGVDVLGTRFRAGKCQRLIHWHGRPTKEDTWVDDKLLSSNLLKKKN